MSNDSEVRVGKYIGVGRRPYRSIAARVLYEQMMLDFRLRLTHKITASQFLKDERVVCFPELSRKGLTADRPIIALMSERELESLRHIESLYNEESARLLFGELTGAIRVLRCWE